MYVDSSLSYCLLCAVLKGNSMEKKKQFLGSENCVVSVVRHPIISDVTRTDSSSGPNSNPLSVTKGESFFCSLEGIHFHMKGEVLSNPFLHFHLVAEHNTVLTKDNILHSVWIMHCICSSS